MSRKIISEKKRVDPSIVLDSARGYTDVVVIGVDSLGKIKVHGSAGHLKSSIMIDDAKKELKRLAS